MAQSKWDVNRFFDVFTRRSESERFEALQALNEKVLSSVEMQSLIERLQASLVRDFPSTREKAENDEAIGWTRTWMITVLAQFAQVDSPAGQYVRKVMLAPYAEEPNEWVRYWALAGLIRQMRQSTEPEKLRAVLRQVAREVMAHHDAIYPPEVYASDSELLPVDDWGHFEMMANALLVAFDEGSNHDQALAALEASLTSGDGRAQWAALRALRFVPVDTRNVVDSIIRLFDKPQFDTVIFEAIMALGELPGGTPAARRAAQCLENFVTNTPIFAKWDTMRSRALIGLGKLGEQQSQQVLLEALKSDNPAIVRDAADALGCVLGVERATERIVETVAESDGENIENYADALRWLGKTHKAREQIVDYLRDMIQAEPGMEGRYAQRLLLEVGGRLYVQRDMMQEYTALLQDAQNRIGEQFNETLRGARSGFRVGLLMDVVVFTLGLALIIASAVLVLVNEGKLDNWVYPAAGFGSGVAFLLYSHFVKDPRSQVQNSINHQAQINAVFSAYVRQLNQIDQAFTRRILDSEQLDPKEMAAYSDRVSRIMVNAVTQLHAVSVSARGVAEIVEQQARRETSDSVEEREIETP